MQTVRKRGVALTDDQVTRLRAAITLERDVVLNELVKCKITPASAKDMISLLMRDPEHCWIKSRRQAFAKVARRRRQDGQKLARFAGEAQAATVAPQTFDASTIKSMVAAQVEEAMAEYMLKVKGPKDSPKQLVEKGGVEVIHRRASVRLPTEPAGAEAHFKSAAYRVINKLAGLLIDDGMDSDSAYSTAWKACYLRLSTRTGVDPYSIARARSGNGARVTPKDIITEKLLWKELYDAAVEECPECLQ